MEKTPGKNHQKDAILDSEISDKYKLYRNDRNALGGGVLIMVSKELISTEEPTFVTECELEWAKIHIKGAKDLYIGCFYMPHRNPNDLVQLEASLAQLNGTRQKHIIVCGDFNCPDIDWSKHCTNPVADQWEVQQQLLDLSTSHRLTQIVEEPTRQGNILDLCLTNNPSLIKGVSVIPGISDHDAVIIDSIIKPQFIQLKKRNLYQYKIFTQMK